MTDVADVTDVTDVADVADVADVTDVGELAGRMKKDFEDLKKRLTFAKQNRKRKDAGAVERDGLENRCTLSGTQGSNPCLSADIKIETH